MAEPSIESVARAWASIDGKLARFDRCKSDADYDQEDGTYSGYIAEAEELIHRARQFDEQLHNRS